MELVDDIRDELRLAFLDAAEQLTDTELEEFADAIAEFSCALSDCLIQSA
ncbi:MAG: hypothetical protein WC654_07140 [Patescibacteria group bacterium]